MSVWNALLGKTLTSSNGTQHSTEDALKDKEYVGLFFGAQWCGWSRRFIPNLVDFYQRTVNKRNLEIVYVSADEDRRAYNSFFGTMPWKSVPYNGEIEAISGRVRR
jgi:thiol-disulfide isomerase/thioredoxin